MNWFIFFQCELEISDAALRAIAQIAMKKNMGARGLRAEIVRILLQIFHACSVYSLVIYFIQMFFEWAIHGWVVRQVFFQYFGNMTLPME